MKCLQCKTNLTRIRNPRAILYLTACVALVAIATAGIIGHSESRAKMAAHPMGPIPVSVVKVRQSDVPLIGNWVGTLDGFVDAQIQPQVTGYLIRQNYRE